MCLYCHKVIAGVLCLRRWIDECSRYINDLVMHCEQWMVGGQKTLFHWISSVAVFTTYLLTTHKPFYLHTNHLHASNCLVATYCPTYQLSAWPTSTGCKSIFSNASVCDPAKIFFTSKFSYLLVCNPTHESETRAANTWGDY